MELFFNAICWVWPLSHTEESDGAISFSNSVWLSSTRLIAGRKLKQPKVFVILLFNIYFLPNFLPHPEVRGKPVHVPARYPRHPAISNL
jgi:hypothetical protein